MTEHVDRETQDILDLHASDPNLTLEHIAREVGVTMRRVKEVIGIDNSAVIAAYEDPKQEPVGEIARRFNLHVPEVYAILSEAGVPRRSSGGVMQENRRRVTQFQLDMACEMYLQGHTLAWIQNETAVSQPTIHAELKRRSIPLRGKGVSGVKR